MYPRGKFAWCCSNEDVSYYFVVVVKVLHFPITLWLMNFTAKWKGGPGLCEDYKEACFQTFPDIWDWESWLQNLCCKCNGKKTVQFHLTAAGTTWKRMEGDPFFEHAMLNLLGSTLLIPHRSAKSQNSFTGYNQRWETYCILSQGVLPMFQFNMFRKAHTQKGTGNDTRLPWGTKSS